MSGLSFYLAFCLPGCCSLDLGWWRVREDGKQDFAGSTVVYLTGAMAALAATVLLKPRIGKFNKHGDK